MEGKVSGDKKAISQRVGRALRYPVPHATQKHHTKSLHRSVTQTRAVCPLR